MQRFESNRLAGMPERTLTQTGVCRHFRIECKLIRVSQAEERSVLLKSQCSQGGGRQQSAKLFSLVQIQPLAPNFT
jgi:hypothetical protein